MQWNELLIWKTTDRDEAVKQTMNQSVDAAAGSYLLRIYRHNRGRDAVLVGTLEKLGDDEKQSFHSIEELLQLLNIRVEELPCSGKT